MPQATIKNVNHGVGRIGGAGNQGIYDESSTAKHNLGEKLEFSDGRIFRYASFAAAVGAGLVVSQDISATAIAVADGKLTAASAGATSVIYTDSGTVGSATADQYAGGYLHTEDDAGEGYCYRIKSNTAASSNAVTFTLFDPLQVAVTTATDTVFTGNLYNQLIAADGADDCLPAGITPISFTSGYYGWIQTRGIATVLSDGTPAAGSNVMMSDSVDGSVEAADQSHATIGYATSVGTNTGYLGINIQLD